ncbi:MAG: HlyD family efflux transporter periplasmic adaptor subunit [Magnetococcus sp. DMHC-6]
MPMQGEKLILGLSALLQLGKRAFAAENENSFGFLVVNETHLMTTYRQAVLWQGSKAEEGKVIAVSGSPEPSNRAPYIAWLTRVFDQISTKQEHLVPLCLTAADIAGEDGTAWEQWLPAHAIWAPLVTGLGEHLGALFLVKSVPWTEPEIKLIGKLADTYANAWKLIKSRSLNQCLWFKIKASFSLRKTRVQIGLLLVFVLAGLLPVQQTVLAPATVVAKDPAPVRSPLDGVVEYFYVQPNQIIKKGDLLFRLDQASLTNKLDVENKIFAAIQEEYRQILKMAVTDTASRVQKGILEKRMEQQAAEINGVQLLLNRIFVPAPRDGLAIFDNPNQWLGKPVLIGEKILDVADPNAVELEIRLPVSDTIVIELGAKVTLYPNIDPLSSQVGTLTRIGYNALEIEGVLSYRLKADFVQKKDPPRIGLRGTAKIQGQQTTLFYYLFRRPLALLRQRVGL